MQVVNNIIYNTLATAHLGQFCKLVDSCILHGFAQLTTRELLTETSRFRPSLHWDCRQQELCFSGLRSTRTQNLWTFQCLCPAQGWY